MNRDLPRHDTGLPPGVSQSDLDGDEAAAVEPQEEVWDAMGEGRRKKIMDGFLDMYGCDLVAELLDDAPQSEPSRQKLWQRYVQQWIEYRNARCPSVT